MPLSRLFPCLIASLAIALSAAATDVDIPDPILEALIRERLVKYGSPLTPSDLADLSYLTSAYYTEQPAENLVHDLTGLEYATSLQSLTLRGHDVQNLTPLADLTSLESLDLLGNQNLDTTDIEKIPNLKALTLQSTGITDVSFLSELKNLTYLSLDNNQIETLPDLSELTELYSFTVSNNLLSDLSPLAGLDKLELLKFSSNLIQDITPLQSLGTLETLDFTYNHVTDITHLLDYSNLQKVTLFQNFIDLAEGSPNQIAYATLSQAGVDIQSESQRDPLLSLSTNRTQYSDSTNNGSLNLTTETYWTLETDADWISFSQTSGFQNATITYTIEENDTGTLRTANIQVGPAEIQISQGDELIVQIPDTNLEALVRAKLLKYGTPLFREDLTKITNLYSYISSEEPETNLVHDLSGLEHAVQLTSLNLAKHKIQNLAPISNLPHLEILVLDQNPIVDHSPIATLSALRTLSARDSGISTADFLSTLPLLTHIDLRGNQIAIIPDLAHIINLDALLLSRNIISDPSGIHNLPKLQTLWLNSNHITSINSLQNLPLLSILDLGENPVQSISRIADFTNLTHLSAYSLPRLDLSPLADLTDLANLQNLNISNNRIRDLSPLQSFAQLTRLNISANHITDITPLKNLPNLQTLALHSNFIDLSEGTPSQILLSSFLEAGVDIGYLEQNTPTLALDINKTQYLDPATSGTLNLTSNTYWTLQSDVEWITFDTVSGFQNTTLAYTLSANETGSIRTANIQVGDSQFQISQGNALVVQIPDPNLEALVRAQLLKYGTPLFREDLAKITNLYSYSAAEEPDANLIHDLTGLEYATQLKSLSLVGQKVQSLAPLSNLAQLTNLQLDQSPISDPSPIGSLVSLESLEMANTGITNANFLSTLSKLYLVNLSNNQISTIPDLAHLANLATLRLGGNAISDPSGIHDLPKLHTLWITANQITSIDSLQNLPLLQNLGINQNPIQSIARLADYTNLIHLVAQPIPNLDLSPLAGLTKLNSLYVNASDITDLTPLAGLTNLQHLSVSGNHIRDLSPLQSLTQLTQLDFAHNDATDITPLQNLAKLQSLSLQYNFIDLSEGTPSQILLSSLLESGVTIDFYEQATPHYLLSTENTQHNSTPSRGTLQISANTFWTLQNDADWLSLDASNGFESATVSFTVAPNNTDQTRTATLTLEGETITITQTAATGYHAYAASRDWDLADPTYLPHNDKDRDGNSNYFEYIADLDLLDPASHFSLHLEPASDSVILHYTPVGPQSTLALEFTYNHITWQTIELPANPEVHDGIITLAHPITATAAIPLYRCRIQKTDTP